MYLLLIYNLEVLVPPTFTQVLDLSLRGVAWSYTSHTRSSGQEWRRAWLEATVTENGRGSKIRKIFRRRELEDLQECGSIRLVAQEVEHTVGSDQISTQDSVSIPDPAALRWSH